MRNKKLKKALAGTLAATLVLGVNVTVFADDNTTSSTGTGTFEGHVEKKAISVTLPTIPDGTYNYTLDPELLINATDHAKYGDDATFTGTTGVYFLSAANTYTAESAKLKAINKSSEKIDVTVTASVAENTHIVMSDTDEFTEGDTATKLYLAVTDGTDTKAIGSSPASLTVEVEGTTDNFEVQYDNDKYVYKEKANLEDGDWNSTADIYLKGACNTNGDWSTTGLSGSNVTVTWSYAEHTDSYLSKNSITGTANTVTMTLPEGVTVSKVELYKVGSETATALASGNTYTVSGTSLTIKNTVAANNSGARIVVTYSDGHADTLNIE